MRSRCRSDTPRPPVSDETRRKMSAALKGRTISEKHREILRRAQTGRAVSEETRAKLRGPNSGRWKGGISFGPYCSKFTKEFKERVREFFGRRCAECGSPETGRRLDVHHVNFHKDACCSSDVAPLFVPLCRSCHMKTNGNREYWEARFTALINEQHGGQCYLPKADTRITIEAEA